MRQLHTFEDIFETVVPGSKIGLIAGFAGAVEAHPDAVQAGGEKFFEDLRAAGVGVHVDGPRRGAGPDQPNRRFDDRCGQQRIALAALPETDHAVLHAPNVHQGNRCNFVRIGGEGDPLLRSGHACAGLQGKAAEAAGIAMARGRQRGFIASQKKILAGRAAVDQGAVFQMSPQTVSGKHSAHLANAGRHPAGGHLPQILTGLAVHLKDG